MTQGVQLAGRARPWRRGIHRATEPARWLMAYTLVGCALAMVLPAIDLPAHYHDFADQGRWAGLPHARDVLSNLAFAVGGAALLRAVAQAASRLPPAAVQSLRVLGLGFVVTAVASALYHLQPDHAGLALDRAGMVVAFAGMLGVLTADRLAGVSPLRVMQTAALLGLAAVVAAWGRHNMTPWALFQLAGMGVMAAVLWLARRQPGTVGVHWGWVLLWYGAAKVCEMHDHGVLALTDGWISGHTLKHLAAACALWPVWHAVSGRHAAAGRNQ